MNFIPTLSRQCRFSLAALLAIALASGCGPSVELPEMPEIATQGVLPIVVEQLATARQAVIERPRSATVAGEYGMALAAYGVSDLALIAYERATLLAPNDFRWHYAKGHLLDHLQRHDEALAALESAYALQQNNSPLNIQRANSLLLNGRIAEAEAIFAKELADNPKRPLAMVGLARVALAQERWADVLTHLKPLADADVNVRGVFQLSAAALRALGREDEARVQLARFEQAGDLSVRQYDPFVRQISQLVKSDLPHIGQASLLMDRGDYAAAIAQLKEALANNPSNAAVHKHLVFLYGQTEDLAGARRHFEAVRALDVDDADLQANWGYALRRAGQDEPALAAFDAALAFDPGHVRARVQRAFTIARLGRADEAVAQLQLVLTKEPGNREANHLLGDLLVTMQRYEEAVAALAPALAADDAPPPLAARTLAAAQIALGNYADARSSLQMARQGAVRNGNGELVTAIDNDFQRLTDLEATDDD